MEHFAVSEGLSRQELLDLLQASNLLSAEDLKRAGSIDAQSDGRLLAKALVAAGMLTQFQMDEVVNRRVDRLQIGNYDVLDKLGTGGTGTVFKARHRRMKRVVALKVLARNLCKDKSFVQRFQREIETIAQLSHPNIVMAYDADEAKIGHYLVMEFVPGQDLTSMVQKQGPLPLAEALHCTLQAARGLAYVHEQGMIHRDIKPANLLRDGAGRVKVTDLGLARFSANAGGAVNVNSLTQAGGVLGSVDYMSPEQALDSTTIDQRSDIYSLGATLYYLLAGRAPYPGQTMMETLLKHRDAPIPSVAALRGDIPPAVDDILRRMMAKTVDERYQSMSDVVRDLEAMQATLRPGAAAAPLAQAADSAAGSGLPRVPRDTIFPRAASDSTMNMVPAAAAGPNGTLAVLVVEPSRTQASIIRKQLQSQGIHKVVHVATAQEALQTVRNVCPDAVVSTMVLDQELTGLHLARLLRTEQLPQLPGFVLLHSAAEQSNCSDLSKFGQAVALQKPFKPEQLCDALAVVTGRPLTPISVSNEQLGVTMARPMVLPPMPTPEAAARYAGRRVLIVENSDAARRYYRGVVAGLGVVHISEAKDGAEAVAAVSREPYDLVISAYHLPLMDGPSLVRYLKQAPATARLPVIMVTSESDPSKLAALRKDGVAAIADKSLPAELVQGILDQASHG
jgi:CheY-like chemotaxis protein/tRNA A-37 threonylcarbamoyl transferase component Bud32